MAKKKEKKGKKKDKKLKKSEQLLKASAKKPKKKKVKKKAPKAPEKPKLAFSIGALIRAARLEQKMTQDDLASRCGTNKSYISRVENNATDMRVSTLMKLIDGLDGELRIEF